MTVLRYILQRILLMIPTLLGVAVLVFLMLRAMPGDITDVMFRSEGGGVPQELIDAERSRLGLDQPVWVQFGKWLWGLLQPRRVHVDRPAGRL